MIPHASEHRCYVLEAQELAQWLATTRRIASEKLVDQKLERLMFVLATLRAFAEAPAEKG